MVCKGQEVASEDPCSQSYIFIPNYQPPVCTVYPIVQPHFSISTWSFQKSIHSILNRLYRLWLVHQTFPSKILANLWLLHIPWLIHDWLYSYVDLSIFYIVSQLCKSDFPIRIFTEHLNSKSAPVHMSVAEKDASAARPDQRRLHFHFIAFGVVAGQPSVGEGVGRGGEEEVDVWAFAF